MNKKEYIIIPGIVVIWITLTVFGLLLTLLAYDIYRKVWVVVKAKHIDVIRVSVKTRLESFLSGSESKFNDGLKAFEMEILHKNKSYLYLVDEYLLAVIETSSPKLRKRVIAIAQCLDFFPSCLAEINDKNPIISARGSRRAGLYNFEAAADDMLAALDVFSSENQFEILMGLARMGKGKHLEQAFDKIKNNVIVNERAVIEILSAFPKGREKKKLFRSLIQHETSFLKALFLKAADKELTKSLLNDITMLLTDINKEVRAAAVRALATLEELAPGKELIQALKDSDWEVRALAAKALGSIHIKEASLALVSVLDDRQWWIRQNAANALICHPGYDKLFIRALKTKDKYSRDSIISALESKGNTALIKKINKMVI